MIENYEECNNNAFNVGLTEANCSKKDLAETIKSFIPDLTIVENNFNLDKINLYKKTKRPIDELNNYLNSCKEY